ncbi:hypothetical protein ZHAS_00016145 [Anopheles sinensis]|uniref:Uncharacterized protein n=1 Tax=Anopheles sinensis TaxID=74873 RepID=A0A084WCT3_ANOSI|nr:hypothetical protein ZHAS_00016145 [Anopheles sinensis]
MAHNESATTMMVPEKLNPKVMASPAPKTASKRSATSEGQWPECSSTPTSSRKKAFLEPGGGTPLSVVSLNASALDRSGSSSSRSRNQRSSTLRITRGIQTIAPETVNRYCTARISRRTASVPVQTDSVYVLSSPPKKILRADATCQTAEPAVQEACVGTSQQVELPSKQSVDSGCQTMALEDQSITVHTTSTPKHSSTEQLKNDNEESSPSSIGTLLNGLERVFGFDVSSNEKQPDDSKEATKGIEKQTACDQQQHLLQESFVNETSKTVATKLDKKCPSYWSAI